MTSILVVRTFEIISLLVFVLGTIWIIRQRSAGLIGLLIGAGLLNGIWYDWVLNSTWMFNVSFDPRFVPLFHIKGWPEPLAMIFAFTYFYSFPLAWFFVKRDSIFANLAEWQMNILVFSTGFLLLPLFEIPASHIFKLWTYWQKPEFLVFGVPYSNWWLAGLGFLFIYRSLRIAQRLAPDLLVPLGQVSRQRRMDLIFLGVAAAVVGNLIPVVLQLFWYAATQPWIPGPRPF